ncbi:hypothetical protein AAHA92_06697 [Salvia divinorum]|uniref:Uncharacterized protein n=1 Tax=Salvia divinorum TaxID=28513 RepID=A0ABD1I8V7_SALDI
MPCCHCGAAAVHHPHRVVICSVSTLPRHGRASPSFIGQPASHYGQHCLSLLARPMPSLPKGYRNAIHRAAAVSAVQRSPLPSTIVCTRIPVLYCC